MKRMIIKIISFFELATFIILTNVYWVIFKFFLQKPKVMSEKDTVNNIITKRISIARFGDGEYRLMTKRGHIGFQSANYELSDELIKSFNIKDKRLLVCSIDFKKKWPAFFNEATKWYKGFIFLYYRYIKYFFMDNYNYGNTDITRFYNPILYKCADFIKLEREYIPLLKKIWEERNVIIVEGAETKLGVGNNLLDSVKSIRRIICPSKDAYNSYWEIYNSIKSNYHKDDLVLLSLGPTATVLATRLTINEGFQCIDVGHVDVVYFWFINRSRCKHPIEGKYVNEADTNLKAITYNYDEKKYLSQIVDTIK